MDAEKFSLSVMIVFGAIIIGGLMAVGIAWHDKATFLFSLSAAVSIWFASFAIMFDMKRVYLLLLVIAIVLVGASITSYVR